MKKLGLISGLAFAVSSCGDNSASNNEFEERADAALKERIATVINLNGHLCAEAVWVGPVISSGEYAGEYQVTCEEHRDPAKAGTEHNLVVYMVNPDTNSATLMGR